MIIVTSYPNQQGVTISASSVIDWGTVYGTAGAPVVPTFDASMLNRRKQTLLKRRRQRR